MPSIHLKHHKDRPSLALPPTTDDDSNCSITSTLTARAFIGAKQASKEASLISIDSDHEEENLDILLNTSSSRRHVRFEDDTPVILGEAVSREFTSTCWYSHDDYHLMRKSLGVDVRDIATSMEKTADRFRTALLHTYSACYSVPASEVTNTHHHNNHKTTSFVAPEDKFDMVACYIKQPRRLGLESLSSEVIFHETNQKRKMVVRNVLRAQMVSRGDAVAIEQSASPLTRSSQLFAHILAKALHASVKK